MTQNLDPSRTTWFGRVSRPSTEEERLRRGGGADPDAAEFHRWLAGQGEPVTLSSVGTLTRLNRKRERRT